MNKYLQGVICTELSNYPGFTMRLVHDEVVIEGNLKIMDPSGTFEIENYDLRLLLTDFPQKIPKVWETSGKIPPTMDRHVRPKDKTLCFGSPQDEFQVSSGGISFGYFMESILRPHLAREYFREHKGYYPDGERSHNIEGLWEPYFEIFNTTDKKFILKELMLIISNPKFSRNALCYCDSGRIYKVCHERIALRVLAAGIKNLSQIYENLKLTLT